MSEIIEKAFSKGIDRNFDYLWRVAPLYKPTNDVLPIGVVEFDKAMDRGIRPGELITISGKTGEGKTLWAQTISSNLSQKRISSLFFSYEMSPWYLKERFVKMFPEMEKNWDIIYAPVELVSQELSFIEQNIKEARQAAIKVVFIDHLHYLIPLQSSINSSLMIGGIVRELKKMAVRNDVVIFLIAHTKKIYQDENLDLSSIRDSGMVAVESDYVFLVERKPKEKKELSDEGTEWTNITKIKLAKNRRTGKLFPLEFNYSNGRLVPVIQHYGKQKSF